MSIGPSGKLQQIPLRNISSVGLRDDCKYQLVLFALWSSHPGKRSRTITQYYGVADKILHCIHKYDLQRFLESEGTVAQLLPIVTFFCAFFPATESE